MNLRTPIPTLEPDDAFVARLSALAAAGAPVAATPRSPIATWRVAFAAAGVAAILVGVAWLAGLSPTGSPQPAPGPATSPSAPESTDGSGATAPGASTTRTEPDGVDSPLFGAAPPASATATHTPASPTRSQEPGKKPGKQQGQQGPGQVQGQGQGQQGPGQQGQGQGQGQGQQGQGQGQQSPPRGPNAHAGDHPNEHATTKSNNGNPAPPGPKPDRGPRSQAQQR